MKVISKTVSADEIVYKLISEEHFVADAGRVTEYGFSQEYTEKDGRHLTDTILFVTPDLYIAERLLRYLADCCPEPCHFEDIIEDLLV